MARTSVLAGIVGHELNNISVPLKGFAELSLQHGAPNETMREFLGEISIAVERARRLAADLDALADCESRPARVTIDTCMSDSSERARWRIDWRCDAASMVLVDPLHAQRAIDSLAIAAGCDLSRPGIDLTVSQVIPVASTCAACDATLNGPAKHFNVQALGSRLVSAGALRDPFAATSVGRGTRRLGLAILVHCAHCAGGHVLLDERHASLSVILPAG